MRTETEDKGGLDLYFTREEPETPKRKLLRLTKMQRSNLHSWNWSPAVRDQAGEELHGWEAEQG